MVSPLFGHVIWFTLRIGQGKRCISFRHCVLGGGGGGVFYIVVFYESISQATGFRYCSRSWHVV